MVAHRPPGRPPGIPQPRDNQLGRPCTYPWRDYQVGGSFTIKVGPGDTSLALQKRLCMRTAERKKLYGEKWKTKQLWKAVKVTRLK